MLYMDRTSAPGESELYNIFCQALESANGRSIIVRTMDIGGDKPVDYLNIPQRQTRSSVIAPCVFMKSTRRYLPHNYGRFSVPRSRQPENHDPDDLFNGRDLMGERKLAEAKQQLRNEHIPFDEKIQLGIMLEVPSVMFIIDQCCEEIDFFSIGSND
ncbi:multiphosphoryl transfer protein 2 [includes phosphoenolpyruvate-protein phosphotransferase);phosphocarrier protein Hpr; fructose-like specific PTS system EIIA component] [Escherichia coli]|uniref:Multiphosphoryl transfer protein 2 [includes phosphoenolpyruvate-protein phosphotransferasephosphocarrier protein Hpr fructose-like specific PTS system EIIA component] n=1 Tax=Escherichia coli TaxID=562 RepID=A0A485JNS9_ECOLX|nr:multiphosphoryl transfer protein 2 [includes phosphoenolpyruvate-protein phosphotransferase);phosphocarrier protein Hpr; fructose-like specific PTS system EIIA component] [Escherichia coli]